MIAPKYGDITKRKFGEIETHIKAYTEKNVTPPISLSTFIEMRPLRSSWTKDEWGNTIHYIIDNKTGGVKLHSPGKDNVFGTTDDIITNVNHQ
jgi:hypothetical protein